MCALLIAFQSFAKNAGLYGERVGALHVVSVNKETSTKVKSQLSVLSRSEISNPPTHGARIVSAFYAAEIKSNDSTGVADPEQPEHV
jgi:aspartate/tyrosine/aromatic aminotransferase